MITIAITAGGTSEDIDGIRKITNVSTGSLGWNCLEAVLAHMEREKESDFHVYYIHTETASRKEPDSHWRSRIEFIRVSDAQSVYRTVNNLTKGKRIDYFIHSMAISDFTYSYSVGIHHLSEEIYRLVRSGGATSADAIRHLLGNPENKISNDTKISSSEGIFMALSTTPKVITVIKKNNPDTFLVGFKLLRSVSESELMKEARLLAGRSGCDMVFANEVSHISESDHRGMLIRNGVIVDRPSGKKEIAESIIQNMLKTK